MQLRMGFPVSLGVIQKKCSSCFYSCNTFHMSPVRCLGMGFCFTSFLICALKSSLALVAFSGIVFPFLGFWGMQGLSFLSTDLHSRIKKVEITPAVASLKDTVCSFNCTPPLPPFKGGVRMWQLCYGANEFTSSCRNVWTYAWIKTAQVYGFSTVHTYGPGSHALPCLKSQW